MKKKVLSIKQKTFYSKEVPESRLGGGVIREYEKLGFAPKEVEALCMYLYNRVSSFLLFF